jgi:hypothetical protein
MQGTRATLVGVPVARELPGIRFTMCGLGGLLTRSRDVVRWRAASLPRVDLTAVSAVLNVTLIVSDAL